MSDLFNIYEDNLNITVDRLKKIIDTFSNLSREKAEYAIQDANGCLKESEKLLKQMEIECSSSNNFQSKTNGNLNMKLRNYTNECEGLKKRFLKIQENYISQKSRDALILGEESLGDTGGQGKEGKHKLIDNEEGTWNNSLQIEQAKRSALTAEKVSMEVMRELQGHSEKMQDIRVKVSNMNENLDTSTGLISRMMKLENKNKKVILGVGLILVLVIIFIFIFKFL